MTGTQSDDDDHDSNSTPPNHEPQLAYIPIYCLTNLTDTEQGAYESDIAQSDLGVLDWVLPRFIGWNQDHDGDLQDMARLWRNSGGSLDVYHFAFFIDRDGIENTSVVIAQPSSYGHIYNSDAKGWVNSLLASHIYAKADGRTEFPEITEGHLESLEGDLLGKRGLDYGRVPADGFRSIWANLDIANMSMSELIEYHGRDEVDGEGVVEMVQFDSWDEEAFAEKLERYAFDNVDAETVWLQIDEYRARV